MTDLKFVLPEELIPTIKKPNVKSILVLGGSDTGKTTLVESLLEFLKVRFNLGVIDCDIGQSHIGPPTTIAWARINKGFTLLDKSIQQDKSHYLTGFTTLRDLEIEDFYFVGSISPSSNILRCLEGVDFIFRQASHFSDKVLIDTTGYIHTEEAVEFKLKKIQILKPDVIIALQRTNELEPTLRNIELPLLLRMVVPVEVKQKSASQRALFRQECFKKYFSSAYRICLAKGIFRSLNEQKDLIDRLVCLCNSSGKHLALGIIKEITENDIYLLTPLKEPANVSSVIMGMYKWQG